MMFEVYGHSEFELALQWEGFMVLEDSPFVRLADDFRFVRLEPTDYMTFTRYRNANW